MTRWVRHGCVAFDRMPRLIRRAALGDVAGVVWDAPSTTGGGCSRSCVVRWWWRGVGAFGVDRLSSVRVADFGGGGVVGAVRDGDVHVDRHRGFGEWVAGGP